MGFLNIFCKNCEWRRLRGWTHICCLCKHIYFGLQKGSPSCNNTCAQGCGGGGGGGYDLDGRGRTQAKRWRKERGDGLSKPIWGLLDGSAARGRQAALQNGRKEQSSS
ncbi:unnamed protein product [Pleuronectes platessa]|uniref:Uncharacterized protein n=1 Tax=Pleuronectes platessa TaxID=8262 RepID=A0A9N7UA06_PLEPL|nr:unnamed protein product [Pleuronectes platessa]